MARRRPKDSPPPSRVAPADWQRWAVPVGVAVIVIATCFVYWPSLAGGFILDDQALVTENSLVLAPDGLYRIWFTTEPYDYWPLTNSLFWLEWRWFSADSQGYHLVNLALHMGAALLTWRVLWRLAIPGAYVAALLWAVHPVNVEAVAWIAQQKTLLASVFFFLSILAYLNVEPPPPDKRPWTQAFAGSWYWLSLLAFVLGMLSKGSIAILPFVLLLIAWWQRGRITAWDVARLAPFLLIAVVLAYVNVRFQYHGDVAVIRTAGIAERLAGAGAAVWFYLWTALWPLNLIFVYPQWEIRPERVAWWLPLAAAVAVTAALWRQRRRPWGRALLFAWIYFCIALLPVLGFVDVGFMKYSLVADHYQYLALVAVTAVIAAGLSEGLTRLWPTKPWAGRAVGLALAGVLALVARGQSRTYRDPITLYQITVERNPTSAMAHYNLGRLLFVDGRLPTAIWHFEQALAIDPQYSEAENNLGTALAASGRVPAGIEHIQRALEIDPKNVVAHNNLGKLLLDANRLPEAIAQFRQAAGIAPNSADAHYGWGTCLLKLGEPQAAVEQLELAVRYRHDFAEAYYNLGLALQSVGRPQDAIGAFENSLRLKFRELDASVELGRALVNVGRLDEAAARFQFVLQQRPDHAAAWANMAAISAARNQPAQAIELGRKALELARQQGNVGLAQQIEAWLTSYQAGSNSAPGNTPSSALPPPP